MAKTKQKNVTSRGPRNKNEECNFFLRSEIIQEIKNVIQIDSRNFSESYQTQVEILDSTKIYMNNCKKNNEVPKYEHINHDIRTFNCLLYFEFAYYYLGLDKVKKIPLFVAIDLYEIENTVFMITSDFQSLRDMIKTKYNCLEYSFTREHNHHFWQTVVDVYANRKKGDIIQRTRLRK